MASNCIQIASEIKIVVGVSEYGKFAKLVCKDEKSIRLSISAWNILRNNASFITMSLQSDSDYEFSLTQTKNIRLLKLNDKRYVQLYEEIKTDEGLILHKYINLQPRHWDDLCLAIPMIDKMFEQSVLYSTIDSDVWYLSKEAAVNNNPSGDVKYKLSPCLPSIDVNLLLKGYLIKDYIRSQRQVKEPHQIPCSVWQYESYLATDVDWHRVVDEMYNEALRRLDEWSKAKLAELNDSMSWDIADEFKKLDPTALHDFVKKRLMPSKVVNDYADIYERLFKHLNL